MKSLCFYYGMKPNEFWESTFSDIIDYFQMNLIRHLDELRDDINVHDEQANKLIRADGMSVRNPKIVSMQESFKGLYNQAKQENSNISPEELTKRMRQLSLR
jgi:hypothetical protein